MKTASKICDAKNKIPDSAIVSDICSSIGAPCVEISCEVHHVCRTMGIAESRAITMMVTAKSFAMLPRVWSAVGTRFDWLQVMVRLPWSKQNVLGGHRRQWSSRRLASKLGDDNCCITLALATRRDRQRIQSRWPRPCEYRRLTTT